MGFVLGFIVGGIVGVAFAVIGVKRMIEKGDLKFK